MGDGHHVAVAIFDRLQRRGVPEDVNRTVIDWSAEAEMIYRLMSALVNSLTKSTVHGKTRDRGRPSRVSSIRAIELMPDGRRLAVNASRDRKSRWGALDWFVVLSIVIAGPSPATAQIKPTTSNATGTGFTNPGNAFDANDATFAGLAFGRACSQGVGVSTNGTTWSDFESGWTPTALWAKWDTSGNLGGAFGGGATGVSVESRLEYSTDGGSFWQAFPFESFMIHLRRRSAPELTTPTRTFRKASSQRIFKSE
jgi:hypothetical protein